MLPQAVQEHNRRLTIVHRRESVLMVLNVALPLIVKTRVSGGTR